MLGFQCSRILVDLGTRGLFFEVAEVKGHLIEILGSSVPPQSFLGDMGHREPFRVKCI